MFCYIHPSIHVVWKGGAHNRLTSKAVLALELDMALIERMCCSTHSREDNHWQLFLAPLKLFKLRLIVSFHLCRTYAYHVYLVSCWSTTLIINTVISECLERWYNIKYKYTNICKCILSFLCFFKLCYNLEFIYFDAFS